MASSIEKETYYLLYGRGAKVGQLQVADATRYNSTEQITQHDAIIQLTTESRALYKTTPLNIPPLPKQLSPNTHYIHQCSYLDIVNKSRGFADNSPIACSSGCTR